jgi:hypothetical protein
MKQNRQARSFCKQAFCFLGPDCILAITQQDQSPATPPLFWPDLPLE